MANLPHEKRPKQTPVRKGEVSGGDIVLANYPDLISYSKKIAFEKNLRSANPITAVNIDSGYPISNLIENKVSIQPDKLTNAIGAESNQFIEHVSSKSSNPLSEKKGIKGIISNSEVGLGITSNSYYFANNNFIIVGEVLNTTNENIDFVKVYARLCDANNVIIGTANVFTESSTILALDSASFKFYISNSEVQDIKNIAIYKIMASTK